MRALYLTNIMTLEYREAPALIAPEGWVRIRMRYVGICGSDIHYYAEGRIGDQVIEYPHILGHEGSGEIIDGAGQYEPGTPVYIEPAKTCGTCDQCRMGRENTCRNIQFLGNPGEGGGCMVDEIVIPAENVISLPDSIPLDEAVLLEPLCIGVYAVSESGAPKGSSAAIVGAGPIGLTVLLALQELDPSHVFLSEPIEPRRHLARDLSVSATYDPSEDGAWEKVHGASDGGVDVVFECAGTEEAINDAARMLRPGGTLVLIGIPPGDGFVTYNQNVLRRNEITVVNIRRQNRALGQTLLLEGRGDAARKLITHRFTPEVATQGFELVRNRADGVIKALLEF